MGEIRPLENEFLIYGLYIASQLKLLSEEQSVIARNRIQSILTQSRLKDLRRVSSPNYHKVKFEAESDPGTQSVDYELGKVTVDGDSWKESRSKSVIIASPSSQDDHKVKSESGSDIERQTLDNELRPAEVNHEVTVDEDSWKELRSKSVASPSSQDDHKVKSESESDPETQTLDNDLHLAEVKNEVTVDEDSCKELRGESIPSSQDDHKVKSESGSEIETQNVDYELHPADVKNEMTVDENSWKELRSKSVPSPSSQDDLKVKSESEFDPETQTALDKDLHLAEVKNEVTVDEDSCKELRSESIPSPSSQDDLKVKSESESETETQNVDYELCSAEVNNDLSVEVDEDSWENTRNKSKASSSNQNVIKVKSEYESETETLNVYYDLCLTEGNNDVAVVEGSRGDLRSTRKTSPASQNESKVKTQNVDLELCPILIRVKNE